MDLNINANGFKVFGLINARYYMELNTINNPLDAHFSITLKKQKTQYGVGRT